MSNDPPSSGNDESLGLDAAYAVSSPEDSRRLYAKWADTYETDFVQANEYVYHQKVAAAFVDGLDGFDGPALDVGCGTGVVGQELARLGLTSVDGIDISPEMLARAAVKTTGEDNTPVYRELIEADLTKPVAIEDGRYAGVISAGAFTHGHLGPDVLAELLRVGGPGARYTLGINRVHFEAMGFADRFEQYNEAGTIVDYQAIEADVYATGHDDGDKDPNHLAALAVFHLAST